MTHEEEVIRTTYAKLSYADEVRIILDTLQHTGRDKLWATNANVADRALSDRLAFELSNFRFGKISAISDRKMGDFDGTLTAIGGEVLDVTPSVYNYSVNDSPSKYVSYVKAATPKAADAARQSRHCCLAILEGKAHSPSVRRFCLRVITFRLAYSCLKRWARRT